LNYIKERCLLGKKAKRLLSLSEKCNFTKVNSTISSFIDRIEKDQFIITVVGEFSRGKSTILNAMLGADIIPTAVAPTTATLNLIHYSDEPFIKVHFNDGTQKSISFEKKAFKEYTGLVEFDPSTIKYVELGYPVEVLRDGTVLVDTPGVNDIDTQRMDITYGYMPISDATVFIFNASTPFRGSEEKFLRDHILSNSIPTLFFIVNRIDEIDAVELDEVTESLESKLKELLKIDAVTVYPISARKAFRSKLNNDDELLADSKFTVFEDSLKTFVLGGDKNISKLKGMRQQFDGLCSMLIEQINFENQQLDLSLNELNIAKGNLHKLTQLKKEAFGKLLHFVDEQAQSLFTKVETTFLKRQKAMVDEFLIQIDLQKSDLTDFAEKVLPYKLKANTKQWFEQSQPQIEQGCTLIVQKAIVGFQKYFSKKPLMNGIMPSLQIPDEVENVIKIDVKSEVSGINKIATIGGATVLGSMAMLLAPATGGLSALIIPTIIGSSAGMGIGSKIGSHFINKDVDRQKDEVKAKLPEIIEETFGKISDALHNYYTSYFEQLKTSLKAEYTNVIKELQIDIENKIAQFKTNQAGLDQKQRQYEQIVQQVNEVKG
jgi:hypothetical protein